MSGVFLRYFTILKYMVKLTGHRFQEAVPGKSTAIVVGFLSFPLDSLNHTPTFLICQFFVKETPQLIFSCKMVKKSLSKSAINQQ